MTEIDRYRLALEGAVNVLLMNVAQVRAGVQDSLATAVLGVYAPMVEQSIRDAGAPARDVADLFGLEPGCDAMKAASDASEAAVRFIIKDIYRLLTGPAYLSCVLLERVVAAEGSDRAEVLRSILEEATG